LVLIPTIKAGGIMKKVSKAERQSRLTEMLNDDPFYTDEELSSLFVIKKSLLYRDLNNVGF